MMFVRYTDVVHYVYFYCVCVPSIQIDFRILKINFLYTIFFIAPTQIAQSIVKLFYLLYLHLSNGIIYLYRYDVVGDTEIVYTQRKRICLIYLLLYVLIE